MREVHPTTNLFADHVTGGGHVRASTDDCPTAAENPDRCTRHRPVIVGCSPRHRCRYYTVHRLPHIEPNQPVWSSNPSEDGNVLRRSISVRGMRQSPPNLWPNTRPEANNRRMVRSETRKMRAASRNV